jgi:hypothetical protein
MINRQKEMTFVTRMIDTLEVYNACNATLRSGELAKEIGLVTKDYDWNIGATVNWLAPLVRSALAHEKAHGRNSDDLFKCLVHADGTRVELNDIDWWGHPDHITHDQRGTGKKFG